MNRGGNQKYNVVQIRTANGGKLIVMLYRGAIMNMKKALLQMEQKDIEAKGNSLIKAQDIILELLSALDHDLLNEGNELAVNLQRLYMYAYRRLVHANIHLDPKPIEEVIVLLGNLLEAWEKVSNDSGDAGLSDSPPTGVVLTG